MAPQPLEAGDQITGCGPLASGSGQPSVSSVAAAAGRLALHADEHAATADLVALLVERAGQVA